MIRRSDATHPARTGASGVLVLTILLAAFVAFRPQAHAAQDTSRTILYLHGRIYTNDPQHPWAQAMATREGKIMCVGAISQVMSECGGGDAHPETVELHQKFVMPGFNDAHMHLTEAGFVFAQLACSGEVPNLDRAAAADQQDLLAVVQKRQVQGQARVGPKARLRRLIDRGAGIRPEHADHPGIVTDGDKVALWAESEAA